MPAMHFPPHEWRLLELGAGIGPGVVRRLEEAGVHSLQALREQGVDRIIERICCASGQPSWANRRAALLRVLMLDGTGSKAPVAQAESASPEHTRLRPRSLAR